MLSLFFFVACFCWCAYFFVSSVGKAGNSDEPFWFILAAITFAGIAAFSISEIWRAV